MTMDRNEFNKFARMHQGISSTTLSRYQSAVDAYINPSIIEERICRVQFYIDNYHQDRMAERSVLYKLS